MDFGRIARFLVPSRCPLCGRPCEPAALVCGECMRELNRSRGIWADPPESVDRISSWADHDGAPRELLAAFKFRHLTALAGLIGGYMADAAGSVAAPVLLVPVPPSRLRTWRRGFDPVDLLAGEVAGLTGLARSPEPVLSRRGSGRQRGRGRAGRLSDPPDIRPRGEPGRLIGGREVLLLDDVMTTGATLTAAALVLRQSGASGVSALTFTRRL